MSKVWNPIPLQLQVLEALRSLSPCDDSDLLRSLRKENDISLAELNRALLELEIRGIIYVSNAAKGRRKIELRKH